MCLTWRSFSLSPQQSIALVLSLHSHQVITKVLFKKPSNLHPHSLMLDGTDIRKDFLEPDLIYMFYPIHHCSDLLGSHFFFHTII